MRDTQGDAKAIQVDKIPMISRLRAELPLANKRLSETHSLNKLFQELQPYVPSLHTLSMLCRSSLTLPCSTAKIESGFSTLIRLAATASAYRHKAREKSSTSFACVQQGRCAEYLLE